MQIADEPRWIQQVADLQGDGEVGEHFLAFLVHWAEAAEAQLVSAERDAFDITAVEALRVSLEPTEKTLGRFPIAFIGSMLVLLAANWGYGEDMRKELTPIEWRLMAECLAAKIEHMQKAAEAEGNEVIIDGGGP